MDRQTAMRIISDPIATGLDNLELPSLIYRQNRSTTDVDTAFLALQLLRLDQV